ncbi:recombinase family protein [Rossellomorea marisflavi]|uniref:recombinase family protein n=1 Tax=Rossellomorea marisflavi TaxID=189381 RepID=UPI0035139053
MIIGYYRPNFEDPEGRQQETELLKKECKVLYREEHSSPKRRVKLEELLHEVGEGDTVVVTSLIDFADSSRQLLELLNQLEAKGTRFISISEGLSTSPGQSYRFQEVLEHLISFQSDVISERTKKGIGEAKEKGVSTGRPRKPDENVKKAIDMYETKTYSLSEIKEKTGISKSTLYRYLER